MANAKYLQSGKTLDYTPAAAIGAGGIVQLPDGRAGYIGGSGLAAGQLGGACVEGVCRLPKAAGIHLLAGGRAYWNYSAKTATFKKVNDRDYYLGRVVLDAAASDPEVDVALNVDPPYDIDILRDGSLSVATGTVAAGGFGLPAVYGGARSLSLSATNEAQCVDILSVDRFATNAKPIVEAIIRVSANGSTNAVDFNIGLANGTSTTDADAVTEHVYFHLDGGSLDIAAQSRDGTTTVTATDTTVDITVGSAVADRFEFWFDGRDPANIQLYVNGVRVLPSVTFRLDNANGPLGLLAHLEKTSSAATAGPIYIDALRARIME